MKKIPLNEIKGEVEYEKADSIRQTRKFVDKNMKPFLMIFVFV